MEEIIGLIITPGVNPSKGMANRLYYDINEQVKSKSLENVITNIQLKHSNTIEFINDSKKYIYIFRSINQGSLDGLTISGFTMSSIVLTQEPIEKIEETIRHLKQMSLIRKCDPFTPLDCLLPGFIR